MNAPAQTPATEPTAKLRGRAEPVIHHRMESPSGAAKLCDTTGSASNPVWATHDVPAHAPTTARPTATAQPICDGRFQTAKEAAEPIRMIAPIIMPRTFAGIPLIAES